MISHQEQQLNVNGDDYSMAIRRSIISYDLHRSSFRTTTVVNNTLVEVIINVGRSLVDLGISAPEWRIRLSSFEPVDNFVDVVDAGLMQAAAGKHCAGDQRAASRFAANARGVMLTVARRFARLLIDFTGL